VKAEVVDRADEAVLTELKRKEQRRAVKPAVPTSCQSQVEAERADSDGEIVPADQKTKKQCRNRSGAKHNTVSQMWLYLRIT